MKKNNQWFSFVELIVVIGLMAIISGVWIFSFSKNFDSQNLNTQISYFNTIVKWLDQEIWKKSSDYELTLKQGQSYYFLSKNNLYKNKSIYLNINNFTWTVKSSDSISNPMNLVVYFNDKIVKSELLSSTWTYDFDFSARWNYKISSTINDDLLNEIQIWYFWFNDIASNLVLDTITDSDNNSYSWIVIKNYLSWKKQIYDLSWILISKKINLNFTSNSTSSTLELN